MKGRVKRAGEPDPGIIERQRVDRMYGIGCFGGEMLSAIRLKQLHARGTRDSMDDEAARARALVDAHDPDRGD